MFHLTTLPLFQRGRRGRTKPSGREDKEKIRERWHIAPDETFEWASGRKEWLAPGNERKGRVFRRRRGEKRKWQVAMNINDNRKGETGEWQVAIYSKVNKIRHVSYFQLKKQWHLFSFHTMTFTHFWYRPVLYWLTCSTLRTSEKMTSWKLFFNRGCRRLLAGSWKQRIRLTEGVETDPKCMTEEERLGFSWTTTTKRLAIVHVCIGSKYVTTQARGKKMVEKKRSNRTQRNRQVMIEKRYEKERKKKKTAQGNKG